MPELVEDEAETLFLDHARRSIKDEQGVLRCCVKRCYFRKGDGSDSHYLPLALKVLGSQLIGRKPSEWNSQLLKPNVFNLRGEAEDPVYSVLRSSFVDLKVELQLLFLDVAVFGDDFIWRWNYSEVYEMDGTMSTSLGYTSRTWDIFDWLSMVHGIKVDVVKERLDVLRKRSLLEDVGDGRAPLGMHDLWRGFAVMETNRGEKESWPWVYEVVNGVAEESSLSGGGWKNLRRIRIMSSNWCSVKRVNFTSCSKVTVLKLNVRIENQTLDLSPLNQLISLEIASAVCKVSGIGLLTNLAVLIWFHIDIQSVGAVEEISRLTNLQVLQLTANWDHNTSTMLMLNLGELLWLRKVRARLIGMVINICLSSKMTSPRSLDLEGCEMLGSCVGVGDVVGLEALMLNGCKRLKELPNLEKLKKLRQLDINWCFLPEAVPGLGSLVALQELRAAYCFRLDELPDVSRLAKLEVLDLEDCGLLRCIPGLGALVALQVIHVDYSIDNWLDCWNLTKLQVVRITISSLSVGKLTNLSKLTALKNLYLEDCKLETLPDMGKDMCLESLEISGCGNLRRWDGVERQGSSVSRNLEVDLQCSWTLPQLVNLKFSCSSMIELPDLSHFPRLRTFQIQNQSYADDPPRTRPEFAVRCHAEHLHLESLKFRDTEITLLPDLRRFLSLKELKLTNARKMSSLTISGPLTALESLRLNECQSLKALPDLDLFPKLHSVEVNYCGRDLTAREVEKLEARGFRYESAWRIWTTKPMHLSSIWAIPV